MKYDYEMLESAMKKMVEIGLLPKEMPTEEYIKWWEGMEDVLKHVLRERD